MAHRKTSAPRRGSLGVRPRKRADSIIPRIKSWPEINSSTPKLLAFLGYKVGITHVIMVDDRPGSVTEGKEIIVPATIIETPPMVPIALRTYTYNSWGSLQTFIDAWVEPPEDLELRRACSTYKPAGDIDKRIQMIENNLGKIARVSVVVGSMPKFAGGLSKKKPDLLEVKIGGGTSIEAIVDYAVSILGKTVTVDSVFSPGQFVDVVGVTKGKGFQGVIKRFGVKELPKWHKHRKGSRRIGSRSPTIGAMSEVPQAGQMGFHRRTDYNKRILAIGQNGEDITPKGGWPHYGIVRTWYVMLHGSIMGPPKRPIILRLPIRSPKWIPQSPPTIRYISLDSKISG
ncbi:MAG: 50S ribosomal protein L3 [Ignisphaera sp.]|uniref:Large ribosomal subunit protein uL3 n=1 Tax=Ignisphaera aggregans TaxID=334771 RepID=A0A7C4JJA9_9CREN